MQRIILIKYYETIGNYNLISIFYLSPQLKSLLTYYVWWKAKVRSTFESTARPCYSEASLPQYKRKKHLLTILYFRKVCAKCAQVIQNGKVMVSIYILKVLVCSFVRRSVSNFLVCAIFSESIKDINCECFHIKSVCLVTFSFKVISFTWKLYSIICFRSEFLGLFVCPFVSPSVIANSILQQSCLPYLHINLKIRPKTPKLWKKYGS